MMDYFNHFKKIWHTRFPAQDVDWHVSQMSDGVTVIAIRINPEVKGEAHAGYTSNSNDKHSSFVVQYAYNRLDYLDGVSFYQVNAETGQKTRLLPIGKSSNHDGDQDTTYGYSESEIARLIQDIDALDIW